MASTLTTSVQALLDAKVYPPTHAYDVATLKPKYPLNERLSILLAMCPDMFVTPSFLDVGCSKGFFSLLAARHSAHVLAIDPDAEALRSWAAVCPENVTQQLGTFKDVTGKFDTVWIGNGHHYLYREDRHYTDRLLEIATRRVIVEGPTGKECREMAGFGAYQSEAEFLHAMRGFDLVERRDSTRYTRGRAVWLFRTR